MDSVDFDSVKAEKAKALRRYNSFLRVGRYFRAAEVCVAILFLFWTFSRLPFAVQISREFLRRIAGVISTPLFVFLLGNCIVVLLLAKSSSEDNNVKGSSAPNAETDIYEALVRSVENRYKEEEEEDLLEEEIVYDDKEVIVIDLTSSDIPHEGNEQPKVYGRSKSDVKQTSTADDDDDHHHMMVIPKPSSVQRSKTEKCMRIIDDDNNKNNSYAEDNLSNEEFQKTIEAFIAKQLIFRRQESLSVVVHNKA